MRAAAIAATVVAALLPGTTSVQAQPVHANAHVYRAFPSMPDVRNSTTPFVRFVHGGPTFALHPASQSLVPHIGRAEPLRARQGSATAHFEPVVPLDAGGPGARLRGKALVPACD
jgi:hypothetical protein